MKKAKERLDAEATYQMTWWERVDNAWFYYKWWLLGGVVVLGLILMLVHDIRSNVEPDYTVGLLSPGYTPDIMLADLEAAITPYADDRNGDGQVVVQVNAYNLALGEENGPQDPMVNAAAVTRFSGDLQMGESMFFIVEQAEEYSRSFEIFTYNDGTAPPAGGDCDLERLGVPLTGLAAFAQMGQGVEYKWEPENFRLVKRGVAGTKLEEKEEVLVYFRDSMVLFDRLSGK